MFRQFVFRASLLAGFIFAADFCVAQPNTTPPSTNQQVYQVKGVITELPADGKTVVVRHEAVTNYMAAMTMPFTVKDTNQLRGLQPGDSITFQMVIAGADAWIGRITKLDLPRAATSKAGMTFRLVRDVGPLNIGDALPEYHFTNQLGEAVSTKQFLGQPFAFTFFFTRCPYPTFCPLMSHNFEAAQKQLLALTNAPANWHLLSISFDPAYDSPAELKEYSTRYEVHPEHWSFVTGDLTEITAIGDQFGEYFGHDENGGVTHNLRTVVIDARGRVQKIFTDNKWTSDELVAEMVKAGKVKP